MSSVPRFFVPPAAIAGDTVTLPAEAAHHAATVLRLREGEAVLIHDGTGAGYACQLLRVSPKSATARVESRFIVATEPATRITVAQALPKTGEKIEQVLQHGTEIGAAGFVLFQAERSVARMEQREKIEKRLERWRGIVQGAAEQSGRGRLPTVEWARSPVEVAARPEETLRLVLHEKADGTLRDALESDAGSARDLLFVVGPEGGFTEGEVRTLSGAAGRVVSLGPRVLRTETAALVALAQALFARNE